MQLRLGSVGLAVGSAARPTAMLCRPTAAFQRVASNAQLARRTHPQPLAFRCQFSQQSHRRPRFSSRLRDALRDSKVQWYHIPVGLGIGFLGLVQFYKVAAREREKQEAAAAATGAEPARKKKARVRPEGPWYATGVDEIIMSIYARLTDVQAGSGHVDAASEGAVPPLGRFNELVIPYYLRVPGFRLYSYIFGVNLDEVSEPDLHTYPNLAAFFYRTLKPGVRPLDPDPNAVLSPADGRVLQFGQIHGGDIEQVKGMTYTVDALLGQRTPTPSISGDSTVSEGLSSAAAEKELEGDAELVRKDEEFAQMNGISYTLPTLLSGTANPGRRTRSDGLKDESLTPSPVSVSEVRADLALGEKPWYAMLSAETTHRLYYAVVYLAPGDYHRFHSPANWVVERRRHFAGELFSVSPYLQRTLPGLFTLNERVVLLGRWRWGFFGFVPVGATNVGSIKINFDRELRTNSLTTDTAADRAADEAATRGERYEGFAEATYEGASAVLQGHALRRGEEMGGFQLGSTIVLVFEAPAGGQDEAGEDRKGWSWSVEKGQKIKVGQALGRINT